MNSSRLLSRAAFSTKSDTAKTASDKIKTINPITKLSHVKLDLGKVLSENNLPLIRMNVKNRKAQGYADPDRVAIVYQKFRTLKHELDQLRKKRNDHAQVAK